MVEKDFLKKTASLIQKAYKFKKERKPGVNALFECLDSEGLKLRDIYEFGMKLYIEGVETNNINSVLSNMISIEQDETARRFKVIQKEAVLSIAEGINSLLLLQVLFSFLTDDEQDEVKKLLNINEAAIKELL